jgi:hypothetical protein
MRTYPSLLLAGALLASAPSFAASNATNLPAGSALAALARSHEQIFQSITDDAPISAVLQRGDKQFVIAGVTRVRAVGEAVEITVNHDRRYSVSATDILFITNDTFGLK